MDKGQFKAWTGIDVKSLPKPSTTNRVDPNKVNQIVQESQKAAFMERRLDEAFTATGNSHTSTDRAEFMERRLDEGFTTTGGG